MSGTWTKRIGFGVIIAYLMVAVLAPLVAPHGEAVIVGDAFAPWSATFPLGTDNLGRDMLTRLIYGIRNTVGISVLASALSFLLGGAVGLLCAIIGGRVDFLASRAVDILMSIPQLVFAMLLLAIFGTSIPALVTVIAVLEATRVFRLLRALGMDVLVMDFVGVARLRGEGVIWIAGWEILPNILTPVVAEFGLRFCFVFLLISALSFLGLGIQPPTADLGSMVRDNASLIIYGDITPLLPAAAVGLLTVSVNLAADGCLQGMRWNNGSW